MENTTYEMKISLMSESEYAEYSAYVEGTEALNANLQYWRYIYTATCKSIEHSDVTHLSRAMIGAASLGYTRDTRRLFGSQYLKLTVIWPSEKISHPITGKEIITFKPGTKLTTKGKDRLKVLKANDLSVVKEIFDLFMEGKEIERKEKDRKAPDYIKSLERIAGKDDCPQELALMIMSAINAYKKKIAEAPQHAVH